MQHSFNITIAKEVDILSAVLLQNIYYWCEKNKANSTHYYDDMYWTYNSAKAYSELFPYATKRQIEYALKKLIEKGYLVTGNYNKAQYDRTLWYAITKFGISMLQNCNMEVTKLVNGSDKSVTPIPNINPVIKQSDINTDYNTYVEYFHNACPSLPKVRTLTEERKKKIKTLTKTYSEAEILEIFAKAEESDFLNGKETRWKASFDWLIKTVNATKVLEGNYVNKQKNKNYASNGYNNNGETSLKDLWGVIDE